MGKGLLAVSWFLGHKVGEGTGRGGRHLFFNGLCSLGSQALVNCNTVSDRAMERSHRKLKCEIGVGLTGG